MTGRTRIIMVAFGLIVVVVVLAVQLRPSQPERESRAYDACWDAIGERVSAARQPQVSDTEITTDGDTITVLGSFSTRETGNRSYRCEVTGDSIRLAYLEAG